MPSYKAKILIMLDRHATQNACRRVESKAACRGRAVGPILVTYIGLAPLLGT